MYIARHISPIDHEGWSVVDALNQLLLSSAKLQKPLCNHFVEGALGKGAVLPSHDTKVKVHRVSLCSCSKVDLTYCTI